jgi:predicted ATP-dependent Lon-type protease
MTMDERMQEILDIVETSFLNKEEKQTLKDQLQRGGLNDSFFVALNERLTSALRKTGDLYEKIVDEYEARDISIRNDYEAKRNKIEAELDKK